MDAQQQVTLFDRAFATVIAFVLPGLAVLAGVATVTPVVAGWFSTAATSTAFVGFLFVLLAGTAIGLAVSSVRWWVFENTRWPWCTDPFVAPATPINEEKRREHHAAYEDMRYQHYYHYLAAANMAVAVPIGVGTWIVGHATSWYATPATFPFFTLCVLVMATTFLCIVLGQAACDAISRYDTRRCRLMGAFTEQQNAA